MKRLLTCALVAFATCGVAVASTSPDVPTAIQYLTASLNTYYHGSQKSGGLGYSVARTQQTNVYKALVALGGVWPATTPPPTGVLAVSPNGNDQSCSRNGSPCLTFARAYQLAQPGDLVNVQGGTYPAQMIPFGNPKSGTCRWAESFADGSSTSQSTSGCVLFQGNGASISGALTISAPDVMVSQLTVGSLNIGWDSDVSHPCSDFDVHDVVAQNITAGGLFINGARYTTIVGGSYGGQSFSSTVGGCFPGSGGTTGSDHIAIDGSLFHDVIQTNAGQHLECIHWFDGADSVVRNVTFTNCAQFDLSVQPDGTSSPGIANIQDLWLDGGTYATPCTNQDSLCGNNESITIQCFPTQPVTSGILISGITSTQVNSPQFIANNGCSFPGAQVTGNHLGGYSSNPFFCNTYKSEGVVFKNNVYADGSTC